MKSSLKKWKQLSSKRAYTSEYIAIDEDRVLLPNGAVKKYYLSNQDRSAVSIIPIDARGRFLLQKEYRYPVRKVMYGFPGGLVEKKEQPLPAAKRELREETGYRAKTWRKLGAFYASPSRTNLRFFVYTATNLSFIGESPDEGEFLEHEWVSQRKLRNMLKNGTINVQTELASLLLYFQTK